jgi:3-dehydroquinate dehydratase/shikimate dehydrogenase
MTLVAVPIFVDGVDAIDASLQRALDAARCGAQLIEWRIDLLPDLDGAEAAVVDLVRRSPQPCIVTCRSESEGGMFSGEDADRAALLHALAASDQRPRYVDVELASFERSLELQAAVEALMGDLDNPDSTLILSSHDMQQRPRDLLQRIERMTDEPRCGVIKIAWLARSLRDNLEAFDLLAERRKPMIALCMGRFGLMSRILAPKFGGLLTFATDAPGGESAPGQPTLDELRDRYRFESITRDTQVYGVIGWPVEHSRSPHLHNAGFDAVGHNGVYLPLPIPPEWEHFKATVGELIDHPRLGFRGASVTIPHKQHLLRFVEERGGRIDGLAAKIGAANTLIVGGTGSLACANTDAPAAVEALCEGMGILGTKLAGQRVAVLGAGGVARAVVVGLALEGAHVVVVNRTRERAEAMVRNLEEAGLASGDGGIEIGSPDMLSLGGFPIIINCTPIGMQGGPDPDASPLPDDAPLDDAVTVFDTVYAPARTLLIQEAQARGARTITGVEMFLKQAAMQFEMWTGRALPAEVPPAVVRSWPT